MLPSKRLWGIQKLAELSWYVRFNIFFCYPCHTNHAFLAIDAIRVSEVVYPLDIFISNVERVAISNLDSHFPGFLVLILRPTLADALWRAAVFSCMCWNLWLRRHRSSAKSRSSEFTRKRPLYNSPSCSVSSSNYLAVTSKYLLKKTKTCPSLPHWGK